MGEYHGVRGNDTQASIGQALPGWFLFHSNLQSKVLGVEGMPHSVVFNHTCLSFIYLFNNYIVGTLCQVPWWMMEVNSEMNELPWKMPASSLHFHRPLWDVALLLLGCSIWVILFLHHFGRGLFSPVQLSSTPKTWSKLHFFS